MYSLFHISYDQTHDYQIMRTLKKKSELQTRATNISL